MHLLLSDRLVLPSPKRRATRVPFENIKISKETALRERANRCARCATVRPCTPQDRSRPLRDRSWEMRPALASLALCRRPNGCICEAEGLVPHALRRQPVEQELGHERGDQMQIHQPLSKSERFLHFLLRRNEKPNDEWECDHGNAQ